MPIAGYTHGHISYTYLCHSLLLLLLLLCIICSQIIKYFFVIAHRGQFARHNLWRRAANFIQVDPFAEIKIIIPPLSVRSTSLPLSLSFSTVCLSVGLLIYLLDRRTGESGEQMCLMSGRTNKIVDMLNNNNNKCNLWHCFLFSVQATTQSPPCPPSPASIAIPIPNPRLVARPHLIALCAAHCSPTGGHTAAVRWGVQLNLLNPNQ